MSETTGPRWPGWGRRWTEPLIVVAACAAVSLPWLGAGELHSSEGHRVIPGLEMIEHGDPLRLEMFGRTYLRKPPGMPWAVALSTLVVGENEWAWRLPSAVSFGALGLAAWWFSRRWFGGTGGEDRGRWGMAGGLAVACMPWLWNSARSAEIEMLNTLASGLVAYCAVDLLVWRRSRGAMALALGGAIVLMGVAKAPAGVPALAGAVAGSWIAARSWRVPLDGALWGTVAGAGAALAGIGWAVARANPMEGAVTEHFGNFVWSADRAVGVAMLPAAAFIAGLPTSLGLFVPWGRKAKAEAGAAEDDRPLRVAQALAGGAMTGMGVLVLAGVSNPRYAMPLAPMAAPLAAYAARGAWAEVAGAWVMAPERARAVRTMFLGRVWAWPAAMALALAVYLPLSERERREKSGLDAAAVLAEALPSGAEVWVDTVVETRPDVLLYAELAAERAGRSVRFRWTPEELQATRLPPGGTYVLALGSENEAGEDRRYGGWVASGQVEEIARAPLTKYALVLLRSREGRGEGTPDAR